MLRPYQEKTLTSISQAYDKGVRRQLVSSATGTGKSVALSHIPEHMQSRLPGQTLVLVHRTELVDQNISKLRLYNPNLTVAREMASDVADVTSDIIVASVATLGKKVSKRADRFAWDKIDKVITDECQHSLAQSYLNIYERCGIGLPDTHKLHVGFTATPFRGNGEGLYKVFEKIVFSYPIRQAIEDGWLVEPRGFRVSTGTSLDGIKVSQGDYDTQQLSDTVNTPYRNQLIVKAWLEYAHNRPTIGFSVDIQHAKDLAEMFIQHGVKAEAVWGVDPERADKIARHKSGETTVLFNCGVLSEGYDDPQISCIILGGPTRSPVKFAQMVGRCTRLFEGKVDSIVLDIVDASSRNSLITLPTLMGMSAKLDLKGQGIVSAVKSIEDKQKLFPHIDFTKLADISTLDSFVESVSLFDVKFPPEVESNSQLSWYGLPTGGYVLMLPNKERLTITQNLLDKFELIATIKGQSYRGERNTLEEAFSAADDLVTKVCSDALKVLRREETWHKQPATPAQLKLLAKLFKGKSLPFDLDKGRASKLISSALVTRG